MKKLLVAVLPIFVLSVFASAERINDDTMAKLGKEVNAGLQQVKKDSESKKDPKEQIKQAKEQLRKSIVRFMDGFSPEPETVMFSNIYSEDFVEDMPSCEYSLFVLDPGYSLNKIFYKCPFKVQEPGIIFSHEKTIDDYRYIIGNMANRGNLMFVLSPSKDFRDGSGLNIYFPPKEFHGNCQDDAVYYFETPKNDIKQKPDVKIPLEFKKLKTWKVNDFIEDKSIRCENF